MVSQRKPTTLAGAAVLALLTSLLVLVQPAHAAVGLHVSGTRILEAGGDDFAMRGVNHPHVWFTNQTQSFADIKSFGANTVRVVLGSGQRWGPSTDVADVIELCKQNRLICVLEVHDTTGFGEEGAAASLEQAATYWINQADALRGQENYVVINIGNEPFGNNQQVSATWATATSTATAINRLRDAGLDHLIMVDGPMWGQDWQNIMRDNAATADRVQRHVPDRQHRTDLVHPQRKRLHHRLTVPGPYGCRPVCARWVRVAMSAWRRHSRSPTWAVRLARGTSRA
jgi:mannan endo-1,4-beta-mannosidase